MREKRDRSSALCSASCSSNDRVEMCSLSAASMSGVFVLISMGAFVLLGFARRLYGGSPFVAVQVRLA